MQERRATRAEIAAATGLSKPTVSESIRRLVEAGAVVDTGQRTTGRGRIGTYYALAPTAGHALVASLAPEGIVAEAIDVHGDVVSRAQAPASPSDVAQTLRRLGARAPTRPPATTPPAPSTPPRARLARPPC